MDRIKISVKYIAGITVAVLLPFLLSARLFPAEGSSLNYRLIGFSFPTSEGAENYRIEIAQGSIYSEDSFKNNLVRIAETNINRVIAEVPSFGSNYTWRISYVDKKNVTTTSVFYHFSTLKNKCVDSSLFRMKVEENAKKYADDYIFLDDNKTLYNMQGQPVWFLPDIKGINTTPRDIKLTRQGTITFLFDPVYEINYNGEVLWQPKDQGKASGNYTEQYNHEFTRLANGHYMVLGQDSTAVRGLPGSRQTGAGNKPMSEGTKPAKMQFGTLIEYDSKGNLVWAWKSSEYLAGICRSYLKAGDDSTVIDAHVNSFYFDEKNRNIYVSFKNISRILKVKYPEGIVTADYGGNKDKADFCGQNSVKYSENGYLYLYNNNSCNAAGLPGIVVLKEPGEKGKELEKIWEYNCVTEPLSADPGNKASFATGGNVTELPDSSLFVCTSSTVYNKLFIVSRKKEILWSAFTSKFNTTDKRWVPAFQYRASICSREEVERLIWKSEPETDNMGTD